MARKKIVVTKPDETGFTKKLKAPPMALGKPGGASPAAPKPAQIKQTKAKPEVTRALQKNEPQEEKLSKSPREEKATKDFVQVRVQFPEHLFERANTTASKIGASVEDLLKAVAKTLPSDAKQYGDLKPVGINVAKGQGPGLRVRIPLPEGYLVGFRTKFDPLEVRSYPEIGNDFLSQFWDDLAENNLRAIETKFGL